MCLALTSGISVCFLKFMPNSHYQYEIDIEATMTVIRFSELVLRKNYPLNFTAA